MALMSRFSRLFKADMHAVLDHLEEPEALLRQAIREMEECNQALERDMALRGNELERLGDRIKEAESQIKVISKDLDVCFESNKEDLAKNLIRRKLETEKHQAYLQNQLSSKQSAYQDLKESVEENQKVLLSHNQKLELFTLQSKDGVSQSGGVDRFVDNLSVSSEEIEIAFLTEKNLRASS